MPLLEQPIAIDNLVETNIDLSIDFESSIITLEDAQGILNLMSGIINSVKYELSEEHLKEYEFVPEIVFKDGSLKAISKLKSLAENWTNDSKNAVATLLGAIIVAFPAYISPDDLNPPTIISPPQTSELSSGCKSIIEETAKDTNYLWSKYKKGVNGTITVKCGGVTYSSTFSIPDS